MKCAPKDHVLQAWSQAGDWLMRANLINSLIIDGFIIWWLYGEVIGSRNWGQVGGGSFEGCLAPGPFLSS